MWLRLCVLLLIGLACTGCAGSDCCKLCNCSWFKTTKCPPAPCCPDDYKCKPLPSVCVPRDGTCPDYCAKMLPCTPPISRCGTCDDYCAKTLPCLLCPPLSRWLQCGAADKCRSDCDKCQP